MEKGKLIILSGPSGVGKGTVRAVLMKDESLKLFYSVSMTTRQPRPGEVNGREYYFVTPEEFQRNIDNGNLLEWAEFVGNRYGTPKDKVEQMREQGKNVLLEIEVNGTLSVLSKCHDALSIFLVPPSLEALENRIRSRRTEPEDIVQQRLNKARIEMGMQDKYDHVVVNDDVERAAAEIAKIIREN
jgi:guanylate kinase